MNKKIKDEEPNLKAKYICPNVLLLDFRFTHFRVRVNHFSVNSLGIFTKL